MSNRSPVEFETLHFPQVIGYKSPDELLYYEDLFRQLNSIRKMKIKELGYCENRSQYIGCVYVGRYPRKKVIQNMLKSKRIELDE